MKNLLEKMTYALCTMVLMTTCFVSFKVDAKAVDFPSIGVTFDPSDESVIVEGIPAYGSNGTVEYELNGYLNYGKERIETFCYAPKVMSYHIPEKEAYVFNWSGDAEFLLPCTGDYEFTAYVSARYFDAQGVPTETNGPKTTITITLHKKDESTNWGPGLPNTTVESYDLDQIKGKDKTIKIEEPEYTWTIHGTDIENVSDENLSLKVTANPESFPNAGLEDFFGETSVLKLNIEHNGDFGFRAILDYQLGTEYVGKYANLFYAPGDGTFEFVHGAIVDENGVASFPFTHASDYVVAITDVEYVGQELNPKVEEVLTEEVLAEESGAEGAKDEQMPEETLTEEPKNKPEAGAGLEDETEVETEKEAELGVETFESSEGLNAGGIRIWPVVGGIGIIVLVVVAILVTKKKK